jgi:TonB family protein
MKTPLPFASFFIFFGLTFLYGEPGSTPSAPPALPQIVQSVAPQFPAQLERVGVSSGSVKLVIKVDKTGKLEDLLLTEYTQRPFADEAIKAVSQWTFAPALIETEPVGWVREINLYFRRDGLSVVSVAAEEIPSPFRLTAHGDEAIEYHACSLRDLDRIPVPLHVVAPTASLRPDAGDVTVDFYIDEEGRVRIPVARATSDVAFANAAADAVSQWQFEPPTSKGKPVLVHAVQIFTTKPVNLGNSNINVQRTNFKDVKIFDLADLDQQPMIRFRAPINYPAEMRITGTTGATTVGFICDSEGHVQEAQVITSSGSDELDQAAVNGVSKWIFKPGRKGGHAVNSRMTVPIAFSLDRSS